MPHTTQPRVRASAARARHLAPFRGTPEPFPASLTAAAGKPMLGVYHLGARDPQVRAERGSPPTATYPAALPRHVPPEVPRSPTYLPTRAGLRRGHSARSLRGHLGTPEVPALRSPPACREPPCPRPSLSVWFSRLPGERGRRTPQPWLYQGSGRSLPQLSDKSQMPWALPRNKAANGMAARTRLRAGLREELGPRVSRGSRRPRLELGGLRGRTATQAARHGDSSAVCAKPRSPRCRVGAGSLDSALMRVDCAHPPPPPRMIHPRPHRKPENWQGGVGWDGGACIVSWSLQPEAKKT